MRGHRVHGRVVQESARGQTLDTQPVAQGRSEPGQSDRIEPIGAEGLGGIETTWRQFQNFFRNQRQGRHQGRRIARPGFIGDRRLRFAILSGGHQTQPSRRRLGIAPKNDTLRIAARKGVADGTNRRLRGQGIEAKRRQIGQRLGRRLHPALGPERPCHRAADTLAQSPRAQGFPRRRDMIEPGIGRPIGALPGLANASGQRRKEHEKAQSFTPGQGRIQIQGTPHFGCQNPLH